MNEITIHDAILQGYKYLTKKHPNYQNETLWIMKKVLNQDSSYIFLNKLRAINSNQYKSFINLIKRRKTKEPLQHILKSVSFYGYDFQITKNVFIPRPETESLIDIIKNNITEIDSVLEVGTGTGCIPIVLELEKISHNLQSLDINPDAISLAQKNAKNFNCKHIQFLCNNFFYFKPIQKYDLIISNPPYIALHEISKLDSEVTLYDPLSALTDYDNGLMFYQNFVEFGIKYLTKKGHMLLEFGGEHQINDLKNIFNHKNYNYRFFDDLNGETRFILIQKIQISRQMN